VETRASAIDDQHQAKGNPKDATKNFHDAGNEAIVAPAALQELQQSKEAAACMTTRELISFLPHLGPEHGLPQCIIMSACPNT
jgi:hypothetical protein